MTRQEETRKLLAYCHWVPISERDQHVRDTITLDQELEARILKIVKSPMCENKGNGGRQVNLTASQTALLNLLSKRRLLFVDQQGAWTLGSGGRIDSGTPDTLRRKNFIKNVGTTKGVSRYEITDAGRKALEASK